MEIWDLPSNEKDAVDFFQEYGILPKTLYVSLVTKLNCTLGNKYFGNVILNRAKRK